MNWRVETKEWLGERCFILGGGASVLGQDLNLIRGQRLIAINSSWETAPWADFVVFSDSRWWYHNQNKVKAFKGRIVGTSSAARGPPALLRMHRKSPPGLADDVGTLAIRLTTLSAAINLAVHLGVNSIVLLGIDGKAAADGRTHHHSPHPWKATPGCWDKQKGDLVTIAQQLRDRGIECVNASPNSTWTFWPMVRFEDVVAASQEKAAA